MTAASACGKMTEAGGDAPNGVEHTNTNSSMVERFPSKEKELVRYRLRVPSTGFRDLRVR